MLCMFEIKNMKFYCFEMFHSIVSFVLAWDFHTVVLTLIQSIAPN